MRLLLDTHVAIWAVVSPNLITAEVRDLMVAAGDNVHVSVVSIWEIAIKHALRRPRPPPFSGSAAIGHFRQAGFIFLNVKAEHAAAVETLPLLHGDPFDRLLVAQALTEPLRLVTHDAKLPAYSDTIIHF